MDILKAILDIPPFNWSEILGTEVSGAVMGLERQVSENIKAK